MLFELRVSNVLHHMQLMCCGLDSDSVKLYATMAALVCFENVPYARTSLKHTAASAGHAAVPAPGQQEADDEPDVQHDGDP